MLPLCLTNLGLDGGSRLIHGFFCPLLIISVDLVRHHEFFWGRVVKVESFFAPVLSTYDYTLH